MINFRFRILSFLLLMCISKPSTGQGSITLRQVHSFSTAHFANYLAFNRNGNILVSVVGFDADVYQKVNDSFFLVQTLPGTGGQAMYPGVSDDGSFIAFSAWDKTFVYRKSSDAYTLFQTILASGDDPRSDLVIHFEGNERIMIVGNKGNIRFYEFRESYFALVKEIANPSGMDFKKAALSPNGKYLAILDSNGDIYCWDMSRDKPAPAARLVLTNKYAGILDITNNLLLATGENDSLNIYQVSNDLNSAISIHQFPVEEYMQLKFNGQGDAVAVTNKKGQLGLYSIKGQSVNLEYINDPGTPYYNDIVFSTSGRWVAASSMGGKLLKIYEDASKSAYEKSVTAAAKSSINKGVKKDAASVSSSTSGKKDVSKKTEESDKTIAQKQPVVKQVNYPELAVKKVGDFTIFEVNKKYGVKAGMLNNVKYVESKYDTVIGIQLEENHKYKTFFILIDNKGLQVYNAETHTTLSTTEKLTEFMYSDRYLMVKTEKGRWNFYNESISSSSGYEKVQLLNNDIAIFTAPDKVRALSWNRIHGYFGEDYYIPKGAELTNVGGPGDFTYKLNNKSGYINSKTILYLPPIFDDIRPGFSNIIQLKYKGVVYSTTFNDIRRTGSTDSYIIKAIVYGKSCSNKECINGIIGMRTETTGGKVEKRQYEKLTINGRILVTSTYVTPIKTTTSPIQCPDRIHDNKSFVLQVDKETVNIIER